MRGWWAKTFGNRGEGAAAKYLRRQGYRIIARQYANRYGEVDLIACDGDCVVFVEVKTRKSDSAGHPTEAVDRAKQRQLTRVALAYLKLHGLLETRSRFDVVAVTWPENQRTPEIEHFKNAFPPAGDGQMFA